MSLRSTVRNVCSLEVVLYLVAGVLTTFVNLAIFTVLSRIFGDARWYLSNLPAVIGAIIFAFAINKTVVFRSKGKWLEEFFRFIPSRLVVSLVFEYGAMWLFYDLLGITLMLPLGAYSLGVAKLMTQAFVIVGNYVLSKFFVFKQPQIITEKTNNAHI